MEKIIEILEKTDEIYDTKLNDVVSKIEAMDVADEKFTKLLDTLTSLISLKLQKQNFIEEYQSRQIMVETKEEL
jgi:hypothetical protein